MPAARTERSDESRKALRQAAIRTAVASGALAAVVAGLLTLHHLHFRRSDPMDSPQMRQIRAHLADQPGDEESRQLLRSLDLQLRQEYFRRQTLAIRGGLLMAGLAALCAAAAVTADFLKKKLPMPSGSFDPHYEHRRLAASGRWSVAVTAVVLAASAMLWLLTYQDVPSRQALLTAATGTPQAGRSGTGGQVQNPSWPTTQEVAANWPRFRGPGGLGVSGHANVPLEWDGKAGKNILWRAPVRLAGQNSPVVWSDRVFVTGADEATREVYCYDAQTGRLIWQKAVQTTSGSSQPPKVSNETGYAAPTATTDGRRVYAIFANGDVAGFDLAGALLWARNLGAPVSTYGHACSLLTYRELLLVLFDQGSDEDGLSRLLALDGLTGREVWARKRPVANSWATPITIATPAGDQLVTCANPWVIAYDPATGREIWKAKCLEGDVAPSPIYAGNYVVAVKPDVSAYAIDPGGTGDVTNTHIAWKVDEGVPNLVSPASDGRVVLLLTSQGLLTCYNLADGRKLYEHDFRSGFRSSPTLVGDRFYLMDEKGVTYIIAGGPEFELIGECELGEPSNCSPAFVDGRIYIRGLHNLYCIGGKTQ